MSEDVQIAARDGYRLGGTLFRPPGATAGAMAIHAATSVRQQFYARFSSPIRSYWIADDTYAPLPAAEALLQLYPAAPSELKRVAPADVGAERIGHFGFFREQFRDSLWRDAADWLSQH